MTHPKAERKARAAAQREQIRQTVTQGYPGSVREEIRRQRPSLLQKEQIAAEVRLQDRKAREGIVDA